MLFIKTFLLLEWKKRCSYNIHQGVWEKQLYHLRTCKRHIFYFFEKTQIYTTFLLDFYLALGKNVPAVLSSINVSKAILPTGPASAGERSCWGTGALLKVSSMTVLWSAEPEMRTLSMAQSFWSRPSCLGCHQRKRVAISLASGGRRIFTNLWENDGGERVGDHVNISWVKDLQQEIRCYKSCGGLGRAWDKI